MGTLYYGDNLDSRRRYIKDESADLVYLDPPFNSAQNYNAFFYEKDGTDAASQIRAFEDTWHWDIETKKAYDAVTEQPGKVSKARRAFYTFLGDPVEPIRLAGWRKIAEQILLIPKLAEEVQEASKNGSRLL